MKEVKLIPGDKEMWIVIESFFYRGLEIPKGYRTDLASIPRILWNIFPPFGEYTTPAVIHDYMYDHPELHNYTKKEADKIFLKNCIIYGTEKWKAKSFYYAVRLFGRGQWKGEN